MSTITETTFTVLISRATMRRNDAQSHPSTLQIMLLF